MNKIIAVFVITIVFVAIISVVRFIESAVELTRQNQRRTAIVHVGRALQSFLEEHESLPHCSVQGESYNVSWRERLLPYVKRKLQTNTEQAALISRLQDKLKSSGRDEVPVPWFYGETGRFASVVAILYEPSDQDVVNEASHLELSKTDGDRAILIYLPVSVIRWTACRDLVISSEPPYVLLDGQQLAPHDFAGCYVFRCDGSIDRLEERTSLREVAIQLSTLGDSVER